jgi:eukaryotic-like serine/threonine-protein kinase
MKGFPFGREAPSPVKTPPRELASGVVVGRYQIVRRLGFGGMGEVYLARDPKLCRDVALKLLRGDRARYHTVVQRFIREARAASALAHPGIVSIFDSSTAAIDDDGATVPYIVMELLDGESLSERIARHWFSPREAVEMAIAICEPLAVAHQAGIVHRDLKPSNIILTKQGPKLIDFGLATQSTESMELSGDGSEPQTLTYAGEILGTIGYMSPEQACGEAAGPPSDQFSFGCILYELLTGRRAFKGPSVQKTLSAILTDDPLPIESVAPQTPVALRWIVSRCLAKEPDGRYNSTVDLVRDLRMLRDRYSEVLSTEVARRRSTGWMRPGRRGAALVALALVIAALVLLDRRQAAPAPSLASARFVQLTDTPGLEAWPSLSPDGKSIIYAGRSTGSWDIYLQRVEGRKAVDLTPDGTQDDTEPRFLPDGAVVAFRSERDGGGLFVMGATGESVRRISTFGYDPAWSPDGTRVACATEASDDPKHRWTTSALWIIDVGSGLARQLPAYDAMQPDWSPHGVRIAYWAMDANGQRDIWTVPADGGSPTPLTKDAPLDWNPVWSRDGRYVLFASDRGGTMNFWRIRVDEAKGTVLGAPEAVTAPTSDAGFLSFSSDGSRLAYVARSFARNISRIPFDPDSGRNAAEQVSLVTRGNQNVRDLDVSPDGRWLVYNSDSTEKLFVVRADGTETRQITEGAWKDRGPRWSPDGSRIAFYSNRAGTYQIWAIKPDGSELRQLTEESTTSGLVFPIWSADGRLLSASSFEGDGLVFPVWSPDGRLLAASSLDGKGFVVDVSRPWADQTPVVLPPLPAAGHAFLAWAWSPSGKWISGWQLREDGRSAGVVIYEPGSRSYRTVTDFGTFPAWLDDERRLIVSGRQTRYVVDVQTGKLKELERSAGFEEEFALARDGHALYTVQTQREGDVWMAILAR